MNEKIKEEIYNFLSLNRFIKKYNIKKYNIIEDKFTVEIELPGEVHKIEINGTIEV